MIPNNAKLVVYVTEKFMELPGYLLRCYCIISNINCDFMK